MDSNYISITPMVLTAYLFCIPFLRGRFSDSPVLSEAWEIKDPEVFGPNPKFPLHPFILSEKLEKRKEFNPMGHFPQGPKYES
jgi:hypothetical protein